MSRMSPTTESGLHSHLEQMRLTVEEREEREREVGARMLRDARFVKNHEVESIAACDLETLFDAYDALFFDGLVRASLGDRRLTFRLSRRMTKSAGTTAQWKQRLPPFESHFEIAVSLTLLAQTFHDDERTVRVTGFPCSNRLEVLQRVMEHELIHLVELLLWERTSCSRNRFQSLAHRTFGHTDHQHSLITPRERAATKYGIIPGARVEFVFEGNTYRGVVNRITKRATVLVEDSRGAAYSDGRHYRKFYIPVQMLKVLH